MNISYTKCLWPITKFVLFTIIFSLFYIDFVNAQPTNDAGITAVTTPAVLAAPNNYNVKVKLKNYGSFNLTNVNINWEVNGVAQQVHPWAGNLAQNVSQDSISIGTFNFTYGQNTIKTWTSSPNGFTDANTANDTTVAVIDICQPLNGTYTVGSGGYFTSFTQAINVLSICGISGNVTLDVLPGTYTEQIAIPYINGSNSNNRVIIKGNNATLTFTPTVNDKRYVVLLNGARYLTIDSLKVVVPNNATYGWNIMMMNACQNIVIKNCSISTHSTSAMINFSGIVASASLTALVTEGNNIKNLQLINNTITGGYYGVRLNGENANKIDSLLLLSNSISNSYYHGVYVLWANTPAFVNNQVDVRSSGAISNLGSGVSLENVSGAITFSRNRILNPGQFALYLKNCDATPSRSSIFNNMLGGGFRNVNASGLYLEASQKIDVFFNSVNVNTSSARGINVMSNVTGLDVRNNSFAYTGLSSGFCAYYASTASLIAHDYNNYFSNGSLFVYYADTVSGITQLRAKNTPANNDLHSRVGNPYYISATDLHSNGIQFYQKGVTISAVTDDIDGQPRPALPCIGADEYVPPLNELAVVEWISPKSACSLSNVENITVKIVNLGGNAQSNFPIVASVTGGTTYIGPEIVPNTINPGDTLTYTFTGKANLSVPNTYYSGAVVLLPNDQNHSNDTIINIIESIPSITSYPYKEVFDWYSGWVSAAALGQNQWEVGMPGKSVINAAHSGMNMRCFVTRLTANYDDNVTNYLVSPCFDLTTLVEPIFSVWLNIKTEPNNDAMILESSTDGGATWTKVVGDEGFYNNNSALGLVAPPKWSGSNGAWTQYKTSILPLAGEPDVRFRFVFRSNVAFNDEGVAIDEIMIYDPPANDVGVVAVLKPDSAICGTPGDSLFLVVKNFGLNAQTTIPINIKVQSPDSTYILSATYNGSLTYNHADTIFAGLINTASNGNYLIKAYSKLALDTLIFTNDTCIYSFFIDIPLSIPFYQNFENPLSSWQYDMVKGINHDAVTNVLYKNLNSTTQSCFSRTPKIGHVNQNSILFYDYRFVDYAVAPPYSPTVLGVGDTLKVLVSDDCGVSYHVLDTVYSGNHIPSAVLQTRSKSLAAYDGEDVLIRFECKRAVAGNYYFDLDNVLISAIPFVDLGADTTVCEGATIILDAENYTSNTIYSWFTTTSPTVFATTRTVTVSNPASYIVVVNDGFGNMGTDTITISNNYKPEFSLGNDLTICNGALDTLSIGNILTPFVYHHLKGIVPEGWSTFNGGVLDISQTTEGGYLLLDSDLDTIITKSYDLSPYSDVKLSVDIAGHGTGQDNDVLIMVSDDDGVSWTQQYYTLATTSNTIYIQGCFVNLNINSSQVKFKLCRTTTTGKGVRLKNFKLSVAEMSYSVLWSNNTTNDTLPINNAGNYWATVTNNNGCSASDSINVTNYPAVNVNLGSDTTICTGEFFTFNAGSNFSSYKWQDNSANQTFTANIQGQYWVDVINTYGCHSSDTAVLVVNPAPFVSLPFDTAFCPNTSIVIDAGYNALYSYTWKKIPFPNILSTSQTLTVDATGSYTVEIENGCVTKVKDTIIVTMNTPQQVSLGNDTMICANNTLLMDAGTGFTNYLWFNNSANQSIVLDSTGFGLVTATVFVTVTDSNGCVSADTSLVTFDPCTGNSLMNVPDSYKFYPNPAQNVFNIEILNATNQFEISIFSAEGVLVGFEKITDIKGTVFKKSINLASYNKGTYLISIFDGLNTYNSKLVIY